MTETKVSITKITQKFLQEHFRKHDSITLYKPDDSPVTIHKTYEPVLVVSQHEAYRFKSNECLTDFCNKHRITTRPTITLG